MLPIFAPPAMSLVLLMLVTAIALIVLGGNQERSRAVRAAEERAAQGVATAGPSGRGSLSERFRRNWMTWYWIGLGMVLAFAAVYHARAGVFHELTTHEGRTIHRDFVFDVVAFTIAAIAYPFVIRWFLQRRSRG